MQTFDAIRTRRAVKHFDPAHRLTAAEEQTLVVEDIARNLVDIKTTATENEENAVRTQAASEQLHQTAVDLNRAMQKLMA